MKTVNQSLAALVLSPALVTVSPNHAEPLPRPEVAGSATYPSGPESGATLPADEVGHAELLEIADDLEVLIRERATLQELRVNLRKAIALTEADTAERRVFCFALEGDSEPRWIGLGDALGILSVTEEEIAELDERETDLVFEMIASVREVTETTRAVERARQRLKGAVDVFFG